MTESRSTTPRGYLLVMAVTLVVTPLACVTELVWGAGWRVALTTGLVGVAVVFGAALIAGLDRSRR